MAATFFYQLTPRHVLLALEGALETHELEEWNTLMRAHIEQPTDTYRKWAKYCVAPFGAQLQNSKFSDKSMQAYPSQPNPNFESQIWIHQKEFVSEENNQGAEGNTPESNVSGAPAAPRILKKYKVLF